MRRWLKDRVIAQVDALLAAVIVAVAVHLSTVECLLLVAVLGACAGAVEIKKTPFVLF